MGRAPSSKFRSWMLKHLQLLSRDFLVSGVAGVDGISSLLICSISY